MSDVISVQDAELLSIHLLEQGNVQRAFEINESIIHQRPNAVQPYITKIALLWRINRKEEAYSVFSALMKLPNAMEAIPRILAPRFVPYLADPELQRLFRGQNGARTEFSDYVPTLQYEAMLSEPKLIVELGTQVGESTRCLLSVAIKYDAQLLTIDIDDCRFDLSDADAQRCHFVRDDDVVFGRTKFHAWCAERNLAPEIDVLFIDTSHLLEHTRQEIAVWMPLLSQRGVAMFHDTNMAPVSQRRDGTLVASWDNKRGVIQAIEEYLGCELREKQPFTTLTQDFIINHHPHCNGFTVIRRLPKRGL